MPVLPSWIQKFAFPCTERYSDVRSFDCPSPFKGNVTSTVSADGSCWYGVVSVESKLNLNGIVKSWPVVVAAKEMDSSLRSGIGKCDVHPAPRMSKSTDLRRSIFADDMQGCRMAA